jgi:hypothetical protein
MSILAVLLAGEDHRGVVVAVLGSDAHPDNFPLMHG